MTYPTSFNVLVVILSVTLFLFLVLSILIAIKTLQIMNHVKSITERAEKVAENVESVSSFFQKTAGPVAVTKLVANIIENFRNEKRAKK
jgi:predicted PurR-regulated permease PerM